MGTRLVTARTRIYGAETASISRVHLLSPASGHSPQEHGNIVHGVAQDSVYSVAVDDVVLRPANGRIFDRYGDSVADGDYEYRWYLPPAVYAGKRHRPSHRVEGASAYIATSDCRNYYHWLIDGILRLYTLEARGEPLTIVHPATVGPVVRESLELCLPRGFQLQYVNTAEELGLATAIIPSFVCNSVSWRIPLHHLERLRTTVFERLVSKGGAARRIYVSRASAVKRAVRNEEALLRVVKRHGFTVIDPAQLSFVEQVNTFRHAECIAGPHGAGLSNMVFAPAGCRILELANHNADVFYSDLSASLGYDHVVVRPMGALHDGEIDREVRGVNKRRHADVEYDLDAVSEACAAVARQ